ncbi:MAG: tetratricopeptide repeat protein [Deltaproteobacteria bacterium]|nr:MAG: tetratricopeptide repeat protein [Deltaproteobacteria bacterium]
MKRIAICLSLLLCLAAAPVHGNDAMHYFDLGVKGTKTNKKIEYFSRALELNPGLVDAYEKRGLLYYFQGKYDKLIQDYETYLTLAPPKAEIYRMLGIGYLKTGLYQPAIYNFTRTIELAPELPGGYASRAEAYRLSGNDEEAIRDSTKAISLRGDLRSKADAYRTRARVYRKLNRMQLAVADIRAAVGVDPRIPRFWRYYMKYASPEEMRNVAPFVIIAIVFVLIFGLRLKPPNKDD